MRDALSLFDQCISYSINPEITIDDVLQVSGNINYVKIIELLNACKSDDETNAVMILNSIIKEGKEVPRIVNDTVLFLRDLLLFKNNAVIEDKLMYHNEEFIKLAKEIGRNLIYKWLDILNDSLNQMRFSTQKRAFLELAILKMNDVKLNEEANLLDRIESLENTVNVLSNKLNNVKKMDNPNHNYAFVPNIPSADELNELKNKTIQENIVSEAPKIDEKIEQIENTITNTEKIKKTEQNVVNDTTNIGVSQPQQNVDETWPDEISIRDVEAIINNASRTKKEELKNVWAKIGEQSSAFAIQILIRGNIVAVSNDAFIVELQDVGFCNRVMAYENYLKIVEAFNDAGVPIKDYICIPTSTWQTIIKDYKKKYNKVSNPKPTLDNIRIGVKKRIVPKIQVRDEVEDKLVSLFDENSIKIMEE